MDENRLTEIVTFMDAFANDYKRHCEEIGVNTTIGFEVALLAGLRPKRVLEMGIGDGRFAKAFLEKYPSVFYVGVDVSEEMLSQIQDKRIVIICGDIETYAKKQALENGARFDVCIGPFTVLHMIEEKDHLSIVLALLDIADIVLLHVYNEKTDEVLHGAGPCLHTFFNGMQITTHKLSKAVRSLVTQEIPVSDRVSYVFITK